MTTPEQPGPSGTERPDDPDAGQVEARNAELPPLADHLRNHPDRPRPQGKARSQSRLILLMLFAAVPMLVLFVVVLGSLSSGPPTTEPDTGGGSSSGLAQVTRYCNYTAQTEADFEPCLDRNRDRGFLKTNTNAARYARGDIDECLSDAGPRCTVR